jgi:hypothetical protein
MAAPGSHQYSLLLQRFRQRGNVAILESGGHDW